MGILFLLIGMIVGIVFAAVGFLDSYEHETKREAFKAYRWAFILAGFSIALGIYFSL